MNANPLLKPRPNIKRLSIVFPVFNEESVVPHLRNAVTHFINQLPYDTEIILVNDGSADTTLAGLVQWAETDERVSVLALARNFGHQAAATAGLHTATGDAVVLMDADLQDPLEVIPAMVEQFIAGYDVVYGQRKSRLGESGFKRFTAWGFYRIFRSIGNLDLPLDTGDFRLISRRCLDAIKTLEENPRFLRGMVAWVGFPQTGVLYERAPRIAGKTKYPLKKMLRFAIDAIVSFSDRPLRLISYFGIGAISLAILVTICGIVQHLFWGNTVPGWTSLMVLITFLSGITILSMGLIGEYIGRIYTQTKGRPLYIIADIFSRGISDRSGSIYNHKK